MIYFTKSEIILKDLCIGQRTLIINWFNDRNISLELYTIHDDLSITTGFLLIFGDRITELPEYIKLHDGFIPMIHDSGLIMGIGKFP